MVPDKRYLKDGSLDFLGEGGLGQITSFFSFLFLNWYFLGLDIKLLPLPHG